MKVNDCTRLEARTCCLQYAIGVLCKLTCWLKACGFRVVLTAEGSKEVAIARAESCACHWLPLQDDLGEEAYIHDDPEDDNF